jgi:hypothetical protein
VTTQANQSYPGSAPQPRSPSTRMRRLPDVLAPNTMTSLPQGSFTSLEDPSSTQSSAGISSKPSYRCCFGATVVVERNIFPDRELEGGFTIFQNTNLQSCCTVDYDHISTMRSTCQCHAIRKRQLMFEMTTVAVALCDSNCVFLEPTAI